MNCVLGDFRTDRPAFSGSCAVHEPTVLSTIERAAPEDLRLVILECPLDNWADQSVRDLFGELVDLKMLVPFR